MTPRPWCWTRNRSRPPSTDRLVRCNGGGWNWSIRRVGSYTLDRRLWDSHNQTPLR